MATADIRVTLVFDVRIPLWTALKLRLMGREAAATVIAAHVEALRTTIEQRASRTEVRSEGQA